jgi:hypothetical protein
MARAIYLVGAAGTSLVLAGQRYGVPIFGTTAQIFFPSGQFGVHRAKERLKRRI